MAAAKESDWSVPMGQARQRCSVWWSARKTPDEGAVSVPKKVTIGYFRQYVEEMQGRSVLDEAIAGSTRRRSSNELEALQREMSDPGKADDMERILERFGHVQGEYEDLGSYALESQAREALHGLGFKDDRIDGDVGALSGGMEDACCAGARRARNAGSIADGRTDELPAPLAREWRVVGRSL